MFLICHLKKILYNIFFLSVLFSVHIQFNLKNMFLILIEHAKPGYLAFTYLGTLKYYKSVAI